MSRGSDIESVAVSCICWTVVWRVDGARIAIAVGTEVARFAAEVRLSLATGNSKKQRGCTRDKWSCFLTR